MSVDTKNFKGGQGRIVRKRLREINVKNMEEFIDSKNKKFSEYHLHSH